jgi:dipeptidyl aminopeptidase/acylaminoacyl peptidase
VQPVIGGVPVDWLAGTKLVVSPGFDAPHVELRMGAPVWETGKGQWQDQSPFRYAANWNTPSLITQGEIDFRVPLNESITTFKILQRQKVPSRLVTFPDEGHWVLKGENSRHHMQEVLAWLKMYLDPLEPVN